MDPRSLCLVGMLGLPVVAVVNALVFGIELKKFVVRTPVLTSSHDLELFKAVVARQMYAALAQIVLLATPPLIYAAGLIRGILVASDIIFVILPSAVILVVAAVFRGWETRAKTITVEDPGLEAQRDAVVRTWMRKPWPDW